MPICSIGYNSSDLDHDPKKIWKLNMQIWKDQIQTKMELEIQEETEITKENEWIRQIPRSKDAFLDEAIQKRT